MRRLLEVRLRTLMALVAIVALMLSAWPLRQRWITCQRQIAMHGQIERSLRSGAFSFKVSPRDDLQQADFHGRIRRYYERAALRPWLPLKYPPPGI